MTLTTTTSRADYSGNGAATSFPVPFRFLSDTHLRVILTDGAGVAATLTLGVDYSVAGAGAGSGTVTLATAPAPGETLAILRVIDPLQLTSFRNQSAFYPETHEDALDLLTMAAQQTAERETRTIHLPENIPGASVDTTLPAPLPGAALGWNARGDGLGNLLAASSGTIEDARDLALADLANTADPAKGAALVAVKQSLTGAVARTQHTKNAESVSVLDFGAVPDGDVSTGTGTDNTSAFQTAINALGSGGVLYVPKGVYRLGSQITIPNNFTLTGDGNYNTVLLASNAFNDATGLINITNSGTLPKIIENMTITGQQGGAGALSVGINSLANAVILRNLWVAAFKTNIILGNSDNLLLDSFSEVTLSGGTGISVKSADVTISNCVTYSCYIGLGVDAVAFVDGTVTIDSVRSMACAYSGFYITGSSNIQISNCSVGHNNNGCYSHSGIFINNSSNIVVSNFVAKIGGGAPSVAGVGVWVTGSQNIIVSSSQVSYFYDGIVSDWANSNITINGCQVISNKRRGIWLNGGDRVTVAGNNCISNGTASSTDAGIYADNQSGYGQYLITGNMCGQDGGGDQDYGIWASVTDNGASTGKMLLSGNTCKFNAVSDISLNGKTTAISGTGNYPDPFSGSAAPTTGTWAVGDRFWNSAPASAGYIGWVCTVAGTPGTWKGFGTIA